MICLGCRTYKLSMLELETNIRTREDSAKRSLMRCLFHNPTYTLLKISLKNADQAFLSELFCLIQQNWCFWLILSIIFQFHRKNWEFQQFFYLHYFSWQNADIIIINFAYFQSFNVICLNANSDWLEIFSRSQQH